MQRLDEGGQGSVFIGHNEALDVPVAIKVIRADVHGEAKRTLGKRLLQEARAAAQLGHPAIVRMMDFGLAPNGDPYLVMELLDGEDLATALDHRGRVNPAKAARILMPIVHALAAAHDKGIVHRDLKPDNIILAATEGGQIQPKLIDFGIAKLQQTSKRRITMVGDSLGTPEYMSPQQARGEDVDASADIWAMSVLLYEMVTGRLPFEGASYHALLQDIITAEPEPIGNLGVQAEGLWTVLKRGLSKEPEERQPTMRAFGSELAGWLVSQGVAEDICGASLRTTWLEKETFTPGNVLGSIPPPTEEETAVPAPVVAISGVDEPVPAAADDDEGEIAIVEESPPAPPVDSGPVAAAPSVEDGDTADVVVKTPPVARHEGKRGRSLGAYALWAALLGGVAFAATGYLGVSLPGVPARWAEPPPAEV
ncbi:MAG: serine/threonine protein kinase, partial [Deltaproteobacteria bacterium]|nr:serine/threonine protein kinase [Deltaproteobacteria bacterium]MBW2536673.1 serine/threonine protein kinase [Deltaproteobacteria bacterium]